MTNQQPPAQFDWATELSDAQGHVTLSKQEAKEIGARLHRLHAESEMRRTALLDEMQKAARQHAENETLRAKIKAYEDLDEAASDVQLLRMGYAAARLEIESLQARIKTIAEEHADELMVAHMDGRSQAAQPAGAQQPDTAYAELPSYEHQRAIMEAERNASLDEYSRIVPLTSTESMIYERAFTNGWNRHASHGQAPAQAAPQQEAQEQAAVPRFNCWTTNDGDSWFDHPADSQAIYDCLGNDAKVGDEYELTAGWRSVTARYRITEVVGDGEEYEVECISHQQENTAPQPSPASQGDALDAERLDWLLLHISGAEFRRIGVHYSGNASRADVDAARKQGANHD